MSIVRTYYGWQLAASPDTSYILAKYGLCSDVELSVGVLIGCFPIMPKFFQHIGPKITEALTFRSKAATKDGDNLDPISILPETHALNKTKNSFAKYKAGSSVLESCTDPYAQFQGEHYSWNESAASQSQAATSFAPVPVPCAEVVTKRHDLEHGHQNS